MFSNHSTDVTGFDSNWKNEKSTTETECQTKEVTKQEKETTTTLCNNVGSQTDFAPATSSDVDMDKLAAWLKRIYPRVIEELNSNEESTAFDGTQSSPNIEESNPKVLKSLLGPPAETNEQQLKVSCISWNSTGHTLAVSYCINSHENWCLHNTLIYLYTKDRHGDYVSYPKLKVIVPACVTALSCHPAEPAIVVAGSMKGQIFMWSTLKAPSDWLVCTVDGHHSDAIKQISWHKTRESNDYVLISAGLDASFIIWSVDIKLYTITLKERYKINLPHLINRPIVNGERGVRCYDFSPFESENFVVGVEGGSVLRCSLLGAKPLTETVDNKPKLNPVISAFDNHDGDVQGIHFSPHRKNLFLSCGSDGDVHIFDLEQESVIQIIYSEEALNNIYWVPNEERLLVGCGQNGSLKLFSLINGQLLEGFEGQNENGLTCIGFNNKNPNIIAVGDNIGNVQIWNVPWKQIADLRSNKN